MEVLIFNAAVGGSTSEDSFYSLETRLPPDLDIVLWEHNYNDYYNEVVWADSRLDTPANGQTTASQWYLCWMFKASQTRLPPEAIDPGDPGLWLTDVFIV